MDLLTEVDSKLFAKCKSEGYCLPSSHPSSHVMVLRPRGHDYDVRRVTYDATKRPFMMRCLYMDKRQHVVVLLFSHR